MTNKPNLRSDTYGTAYGYPSPNPVRIVFDTEEQRNKLLQSMREICGDSFTEPEIGHQPKVDSLRVKCAPYFIWRKGDRNLAIVFNNLGTQYWAVLGVGYFKIKQSEDLEEKLKELWMWLTKGGGK